MQTEKLKKLSVQVMIGSLVGAAILAVIAVLAGSFSDTFWRALFTLAVVMVHALLCLAFIDQTSRPSHKDFKFFDNSVFAIIVLSFFTSIFGVWGILDTSIVGKLYLTYGVLLFACLHGQLLADTTGKQPNIDNIVYANYLLMAAVVIMLLPLIWLTDTDYPSIYYRILAAFGIIDATLSILAAILHKMYLQKHPEIQSTIFSVTTQLDANGQPVPVKAEVQKRHIHPLLWILGIFLIGQLVLSLLFGLLGAFYH